LQARFARFLGTFWRLARDGRRIRFIREIDGMLPRVFRPESAMFRNIQVEPFGMVNIDCKGNVSTFSPELLGLRNAQYRDFIIGNVHSASLEQMRASAALRAMERDIASGVETCRQSCDYFSVCGGGAPVNKLFENGSFANILLRSHPQGSDRSDSGRVWTSRGQPRGKRYRRTRAARIGAGARSRDGHGFLISS
jgi:uncharacterized protein